MKILATLALGFGLAIATPATAQVMGSTNRTAPTCTNIIEFADGPKLTLKYTAITFAGGKWAKNLSQMRPFINQTAERRPMGELHADGDFLFGGKELAKGKYKVYFTLTEKLNWVLNVQDLEGQKDAVTWELKLKKAGSKQSRLNMMFKPTEKANTCHMMLAFGDKAMEVPFMPAPMTDK